MGLVGLRGLSALRLELDGGLGLSGEFRAGEEESVFAEDPLEEVSTTRALGLNLADMVPATDLRRLLIDQVFDGFCRSIKRKIKNIQHTPT